MSNTFVLVPDGISHNSVEAAKAILQGTEGGEIIGFIFGLMFVGNGKKYVVNATGEAYDSPTFARGMAAALDDFLRERAKELQNPK